MHQQTSVGKILATALLTGVAGWVMENVLFGSRYSYHFPHLPFMPVYAVGGAAIALMEPRVSHWSLPAQAFAYGGTLTAIEGVAGLLERTGGRADGQLSWDYGGSPIDAPHAIAWTLLGTLVGQTVNQFP